jgi:drug/metabolite transporter (DMT)-like permease
MYNYAVSRLPASQAAAFVNLIPVFTLLMAMLLLGESLNPAQWLASTLVFAGVWLSQRKPVESVALAQQA